MVMQYMLITGSQLIRSDIITVISVKSIKSPRPNKTILIFGNSPYCVL